MTRALEVVEQAAAHASDWERDREAWNLPQRPVEGNEASEPATLRTAVNEDSAEPRVSTWIKQLPKSLSALDRKGLRDATDIRDERISALLRGWPKLSELEMTEARRLNDERQRLARYVGSLRKQVPAPPH